MATIAAGLVQCLLWDFQPVNGSWNPANGGRLKAMPLPGRARQSKALAALVPPHWIEPGLGTIRGATGLATQWRLAAHQRGLCRPARLGSALCATAVHSASWILPPRIQAETHLYALHCRSTELSVRPLRSLRPNRRLSLPSCPQGRSIFITTRPLRLPFIGVAGDARR